METKQFIERVYELAFGHDAINRNFGHAEVIEQLEEFNEDSLKWDSIPDDEKEEYENAFYMDSSNKTSYNKESVDKAIKQDKRIKAKEAKMIHSLLKGRITK